jgi:uncharacterized protein
MITPSMYGRKLTPVFLSDEKKNQCLLSNSESDKSAELLLRHIVAHLGCIGGIACDPLSKDEMDKLCIKNSLSRAWRLGRSILEARKEKINPLEAIKSAENGKLIFVGKMIDVHRYTAKGYNFGEIKLEGMEDFKSNLNK